MKSGRDPSGSAGDTAFTRLRACFPHILNIGSRLSPRPPRRAGLHPHTGADSVVGGGTGLLAHRRHSGGSPQASTCFKVLVQSGAALGPGGPAAPSGRGAFPPLSRLTDAGGLPAAQPSRRWRDTHKLPRPKSRPPSDRRARTTHDACPPSRCRRSSRLRARTNTPEPSPVLCKGSPGSCLRTGAVNNTATTRRDPQRTKLPGEQNGTQKNVTALHPNSEDWGER